MRFWLCDGRCMEGLSARCMNSGKAIRGHWRDLLYFFYHLLPPLLSVCPTPSCSRNKPCFAPKESCFSLALRLASPLHHACFAPPAIPTLHVGRKT
ncbi:hypothetical protein LY76DRAFT_47883 [Colletotrichum caudatum]|nr:hypothetical protein LY76DRAFT_47883 [Colletotrichum caudatum]